MIDFKFPPLGSTGEGEVSEHRQGEVYWLPEPSSPYFVTHQHDHPAVAFRCHYPGGAAPCDQATADSFIEWAKDKQ